MKLSNKIITVPAKLSKGAIAGIVAAVVVVGGCATAYVYGNSSDKLPPDTNEQMAGDVITEEELGFVNDVRDTELDIPWSEMGYDSLDAYWEDINAKRAEADGMTDSVLAKYGNIFDDAELEQLYAAENKMKNAALMTDYEDALNAFNGIVDANKPKPVVSGGGSGSSGGGNYTGGGYDIPYNFKQMGVLHDDDYRYTYYSSQVLYHYKTPQWTLGSDGIYRDSRGYVIVASDAHPQGTVLETDLWGTVVVEDCGVGRSDTLDVYVGF